MTAELYLLASTNAITLIVGSLYTSKVDVEVGFILVMVLSQSFPC